MCLGLASGYHEPEKEMTPEKALEWVKDFEKSIKEEQAIVDNGDEFHIEALKVCEVVKQALEKSIQLKEKRNAVISDKESFEIESYLLDREKPDYKLSEKIMEVVEKQIPKKPIDDGWGSYLKLCPNCKSKEIYDHEKMKQRKRCDDCGQALDLG